MLRLCVNFMHVRELTWFLLLNCFTVCPPTEKGSLLTLCKCSLIHLSTDMHSIPTIYTASCMPMFCVRPLAMVWLFYALVLLNDTC